MRELEARLLAWLFYPLPPILPRSEARSIVPAEIKNCHTRALRVVRLFFNVEAGAVPVS